MEVATRSLWAWESVVVVQLLDNALKMSTTLEPPPQSVAASEESQVANRSGC
jgi:hypothetical protein